MKIKIKLVKTHLDRGIQKLCNIVGYYRICEETNCPRYIPCPYVRCQDHRTDYAIKDNIVNHYEPDQVEIINA